jgi:hypothetical protein
LAESSPLCDPSAEFLQSREMTESGEAALAILFEFFITGHKKNNFNYSGLGR